jgi:hypothetical protein
MEFFADDSVVQTHNKFVGRLRNRTSDEELSETQSLSESEMERYRSKFNYNAKYLGVYHNFSHKPTKKSAAKPTVTSGADHNIPKKQKRSNFPSTRETEQSMAIQASRRDMTSEPVENRTPRSTGSVGGRKREKVVYLKQGNAYVIIAGTLNKLVAMLADDNVQDPEYIDVFLQTHTSFISSHRLFSRLVHRYKKYSQSNLSNEYSHFVQMRIINVIKKWLKISFVDFEEEKMKRAFDEFLDYLKSNDKGKEYAEFLKATWTSCVAQKEELKKDIVPGPNAPKPLVPKMKTTLDLIDIEPIELARQLTLVDYKLFRDIVPATLSNKARESGDIPSLKAIKNRSELIQKWVCLEIISTDTMKQRVMVLAHFISVVYKLMEINNYHTALCVYLGIASHHVVNMKETWKALTNKCMERWKHLSSIMSPYANFEKLRQRLATCRPPMLIPLSVIFHDLVLIEEEQNFYKEREDTVDNELINFEKFRRLKEVIDQFTKCQSRPYMFHKVDVIQDYIEKRLVPVSDQELDQIAEEQLEKEKSAHEQTRSRIHFHKSKKSVHNASGSNTNSPSDSAKK